MSPFIERICAFSRRGERCRRYIPLLPGSIAHTGGASNQLSLIVTRCWVFLLVLHYDTLSQTPSHIQQDNRERK